MRSPKDAAMSANAPSIRQCVRDAVAAFTGPANTLQTDTNRLMELLFDAAGASQCVSSGSEAMWLLTHSERVHADLLQALEMHAKGAPWTMHLAVREWDPRVRLSREWRGFVARGQLIALSQYNDHVFYPEPVGHEKDIMQACHSRWQAMTHDPVAQAYLSEFPALVVDFCCWPADETPNTGSSKSNTNSNMTVWEACCVEVNPFGPITGPSLFQWSVVSDRILLSGVEVWSLARDSLPLPGTDNSHSPADVLHSDSVATEGGHANGDADTGNRLPHHVLEFSFSFATNGEASTQRLRRLNGPPPTQQTMLAAFAADSEFSSLLEFVHEEVDRAARDQRAFGGWLSCVVL
jgi:hypothetical protein